MFIKQEGYAPADRSYFGYLHWRRDAALDAVRARVSRVNGLPPENMVRSRSGSGPRSWR